MFIGPSVDFQFFPSIVMFGIVCVFVIIAFQLLRSFLQWSANNAAERMTVSARVVAKRTKVFGGAGESSTSTKYYVTFEFENRGRMELRVSGREYGLMAEGDYGLLTRQGTRFLDFSRQ